MSTETGASTAAGDLTNSIDQSSNDIPSPSALPTESATGWLPR